VLNAGIDSSLLPRGALMSLIQKGILFAEAEVFSLLAEGEIETKFDKAIGSMSLLECGEFYFLFSLSTSRLINLQ
jgi:hypothetical protein